MQSYTLATMAILIAAGSIAAYAYSPAMATEPLTKVIQYAKPLITQQDTAQESVREQLEALDVTDVVISPEAQAAAPERQIDESVQLELEDDDVASAETISEQESVSADSDLTIEEDVAVVEETIIEEAVVEVTSGEPGINAIQFSTNIDQNYRPVSPRIEFPEGNYKLYATFNYDNVASGSSWEWVWKHNGVVVSSQTAQWSYGESGPGWVFFSPETGFATGSYSLEMWLDGELVSQSNLNVSGSAANQ